MTIAAIILQPGDHKGRPDGHHYEIEWRGPLGPARAGRWYRTYAEAHEHAEDAGAATILDESACRPSSS
jgi:hypothetical protein